MIEFTEIRIRAALPLHPYLAEHPRLSLRLIAAGNVCGETHGVNGNLVTGAWTFNSTLSTPPGEQSLAIAVTTGPKNARIQVVSVTIDVAEFLVRVKDPANANGRQEFEIFDSPTPLQLKLFMTCSIELSPTLDRALQAIIDRQHTTDNRRKNTQPDFEPEKADLSSRRDLESLYAKAIRMPDRDDNKAGTLSLLGHQYHALYLEGRGSTHLEKAVSLHEEAMQSTGPLHPQLAKHAQRFSMALVDRFKHSSDPIDIERAISHCNTALKFTEDRGLDKTGPLTVLGNILRLRFEHMGDLTDVENSIVCLKQAVELTPDGHPEKPGWFSNLGNALLRRFERLGCLTDLADAILNLRKAVKLMPDGHRHKPGVFSNLGVALKSRFERLGSLVDMEDSIWNMQKAVELTPDGHPDKPSRLDNLGGVLQLRIERLGSLTDVEKVISRFRTAVDQTPDSHPDKPSLLNGLGGALRSRFDRLDSLTDIEGAVSAHRKAVELTPDGHPDKPGLVNNLGGALQSRYKRLGSLIDMEDAVSDFRKAIELTPDGHPDKPSRVNNLGGALQSRFERLGSLIDMEDAVSNFRKAIELTPDGHPEKPGRLSNLGNALQSRFERLDSLADLEDAIWYIQKAVELTPDGHPDKPGQLSNLGNALRSRFARLGSLADIDAAISNKQMSVDLMPDGHPEKPTMLGNLGTALYLRFYYLDGLEDMEDVIWNMRKAVKLAPDDHPDMPRLLSNLGSALARRFSLLGGLADIDDAISSQKKAVELTSDAHPSKPNFLNNLGVTLQSRYDRLGSPTDLEDAIWNMQKAIELIPDGHPGKPTLLSDLSISFLSRFERLDSLVDIDDAISNQQEAVEATPDGHPENPSQLLYLGRGFLTRFERVGVLSDLESALSAFSTAAKATGGSARMRLYAARRWAKAADKYSKSPLEAFGCAIDLLPRIAWLGLAVTDQHALLADVGGIVRDAVATAIRYEEYETAVVWAEQGRSIVWQNLFRLRSPVDDLRRAHPRLADQLQNIARQLEGSSSHDTLRNEGQGLPVGVSRRYFKLAIEWDNLVDEIRGLPNFEGFLRAKRFSQLATAAHEGPVVILNVNDSQCDALVLIADDSPERHVSVVNIPLERFSYEKSKKLFQALTDVLSSTGVRERNDRKTGRAKSQADDEAKFKRILRILWQDVVKPVIEGLAFQTESKRPSRIWWCATGLLAFLPIHAAGLYETEEIGEKVSDYVVSSYTPTLSAILDLSEPVVRDDFQVLTVAQAFAPGASPIPQTENEVQIVHRLTAGARGMSLMRENATVERVRQGMMKSHWIHLACHGQQNPNDPMESGFLLHDKILKLSEIVTMSLPKADFAFLSACQTAMGDEKVSEESVHLAAGMFLSGCRGVIATTWSIRDDDAPKITEDVYSRIFKDGKPNRKEAAYALHEAVKRLRESGAQCTSWVPFIHIGR